MTLTPSIDMSPTGNPADDVQALIWALISGDVRLVAAGVFEVTTVQGAFGARRVRFTVRVENE